MGLRSFVALPLESGGVVLRSFVTHDTGADATALGTSIAVGIDRHWTVLLSAPVRLHPDGEDRLGRAGTLLRWQPWIANRPQGTTRLGLLGGVATEDGSQRAWLPQAGTVLTHVDGRHAFDFSGLYAGASGAVPATGRYDLSWQVHLLPAERPDWGMPPEWYGVVEFNGRWRDGNGVREEWTAGLQRVAGAWVIEGGVFAGLHGPARTAWMLGFRHHF